MSLKNKLKKVSVFAPASVANVSCGFDVMGFALKKPGDKVTASRSQTKGVQITKITGDDGLLPTETKNNTAGIAAKALLDHLDYREGVSLTIDKQMPMGSGLGSSAASAVGAVIAVNHLLGTPLEPKELLSFAAKGEKVASGSIHYDNVAPSLTGKFVFIRGQHPLDIIELDCPVPLFSTVVHPQIQIQTGSTRKLLNKNISLQNAVTQWGNVGGLVAGLLKGDYDLISNSLTDVIIEPIRGVLIPGFKEVTTAALDAGVLGSGISGSGPSVFALSATRETARKAGESMQKTFNNIGLDNEVYISKITENAPRILKEE